MNLLSRQLIVLKRVEQPEGEKIETTMKQMKRGD